MSHNVLVTGAAGFVGRYVAKAFASQGSRVHGIGWGKFANYKDWGISAWNESEVSLETLVDLADSPDLIVHCAGGSAVGYSIDHPRQDFCLTVDTTSHVLEYIKRHCSHCRLVYPSTAAVYGQVDIVPINEGFPLKPISPYGTHKKMAEDLCRLYAGHYGVEIAIVRLFSIFGAGLRKQLLWEACHKYSRGESEFFGTGEEIRDWLHVSDAARLLLLAAQHATPDCPVVNGGSGIGTRIRDLLETLASKMHLDIQPTFSSVGKTGDPDSFVANIDSAKMWGWKPEQELTAGLNEYVAWFLAERDRNASYRICR